MRPSASRMSDEQARAIAGEISAGFFNSGKRILHGWNPSLRRADDDVRSAGRVAAARAIEGMHNSGWLAGAIEAAAAGVVGPGLRLNAKPDYVQLKWSEDEASKWGRMVERQWEAWADSPLECDAAGKATIGQLTNQAFRGWFAYGEILATIEAIRRPGAKHRTKLQLLDPVTLPRNQARLDARDSILTDRHGAAQSYIFKVRDEGNPYRETDRIVPARTNTGRPLVVHVFDGQAQQRRGISPLAPVLHVVRKYDQLSDATLTKTLLQTIFAATLESQQLPAEAFQAIRSPSEQGSDTPMLDEFFKERLAWYKQSAIDLQEHGKVAHLFPGEKFEFKAPAGSATDYETFAKFLLRECARCIGVTFETMTGDYSGATYSSVRMATSETWQIVLYRRKNIAARLPQAAYEAWLEESVFDGSVAFPGGHEAFIANRSAAVKADWRGPARPTADDQKATTAAATRISSGLSTLENECAENGLDWEEVIDQLAREQAYREKRGVILGTPQDLAEQQAAIAKEEAQHKPAQAQKPKQKQGA